MAQVYIVVRESFSFENSESEIVGVYSMRQDAEDKVKVQKKKDLKAGHWNKDWEIQYDFPGIFEACDPDYDSTLIIRIDEQLVR